MVGKVLDEEELEDEAIADVVALLESNLRFDEVNTLFTQVSGLVINDKLKLKKSND